MRKEIEFTKSFAIKKKGDRLMCDGILASELVHVKKVAKYVGKKHKDLK